MGKTFDKNDVLRFLYDEMEPIEQDDFLDQLCNDEELWNTYEELKASKEQLEPKVLIDDPSVRSIQKVLNFARHSVLHSPEPSGVSGHRRVPFHIVLSVIMVICTSLTISLGVYAYNHSSDDTIYTSETTQVQWDISHLDRRIQKVKLNLQNLSGNRETVLPLYHDTYRLVKTADFSPGAANVVLLNLK